MCQNENDGMKVLGTSFNRKKNVNNNGCMPYGIGNNIVAQTQREKIETPQNTTYK